MAPAAPADRYGFQIAIICALDIEADAVHDVLDKFWEDEGFDYDQAYGDNTTYTTGVIGEHNVVLAYMPGIGTADASAVAANLQSSFPSIRLTLLVGICGGAPNNTQSKEVFLGDLVISTSVMQYDFGKQHPLMFERADTLDGNRSRPSQKLRGILNKLNTRRYYQKMQSEIQHYVLEAQKRHPGLDFPGRNQDRLYETNYLHKHHVEDTSTMSVCEMCNRGEAWICKTAPKLSCEDLGCDSKKVVSRTRKYEEGEDSVPHLPMIHFGKIGSGNTVMRSGEHRDSLAKSDGVIALEMESAGILDHFPSFLMIKGVCDYADSHKNKTWQPYAALVAAAGMKVLLNNWSPSYDTSLFGVSDSSASIRSNTSIVPGSRNDSLNVTYSNARKTQGPRMVDGHLLGMDSIRESKVKTEGKTEYQELQNEIKKIETAINTMQSSIDTLLAEFKPTTTPKKHAPLRFKDAIGRNYNFPFERCKRWRDMESLIVQAFQNIEDLGEHVIQGRYDLIGPDKEIIMPQYWDYIVQPDMQVTMMLWPLPETPPEIPDPQAGHEQDTVQESISVNEEIPHEKDAIVSDANRLKVTNLEREHSRWIRRIISSLKPRSSRQD